MQTRLFYLKKREEMEKTYVILKMYDSLMAGEEIKLVDTMANYGISIATFRRYVSFLRYYFLSVYGRELVYDAGENIYKLAEANQ